MVFRGVAVVVCSCVWWYLLDVCGFGAGYGCMVWVALSCLLALVFVWYGEFSVKSCGLRVVDVNRWHFINS